MNDDSGNKTGDQSASTAPQKFTTGRVRAIPEPCQSIQANFCRSPGCENFGVAPLAGPILTGRGSSTDGYALNFKRSPAIVCKRCGRASILKSNQAIHEEMQRQGGLIWRDNSLRCPNADCTSHHSGARFRKYGTTRAGSPRFQCGECKATFSIGKSTLRQKQPHKNAVVFELLLNKVPFNRMREITDLSVVGLYGKINFIYEQCRHFAADRERHLATMAFDRLYLSTDRQDYIVNWPDKKVRKTIQLTAIATADLESGYVFGLTPNYDASITQADLEARWRTADDGSKPVQMRQTARLWTLADYAGSIASESSEDETTEAISDGQQLPTSGCQVHADYLMYGHYQLLRHHFQGADKLRFFLDADSGLIAACVATFADRIKVRTADAAVLRIDKELTVDARKASLARAIEWFRNEQKRFPGLSEKQARSAIMTEIVAAARETNGRGHLRESWIASPFPDPAEPNKRVRFLSDLGDYDDAHVANLLLMATLWPIDSVFNRIRRRLTLCERPVNSSRRANRRWHIYAPYDPQMVNKVLTIFRVWHNYVWISPKSNQTSAEHLGLAQGKIRIQDILSFKIQ